MNCKIRPVFVLDLDAWAAELEFDSGEEFLVSLDHDKPVLVRFDDDGRIHKLQLDEFHDGVQKAIQQIAQENARDDTD